MKPYLRHSRRGELLIVACSSHRASNHNYAELSLDLITDPYPYLQVLGGHHGHYNTDASLSWDIRHTWGETTINLARHARRKLFQGVLSLGTLFTAQDMNSRLSVKGPLSASGGLRSLINNNNFIHVKKGPWVSSQSEGRHTSDRWARAKTRCYSVPSRQWIPQEYSNKHPLL